MSDRESDDEGQSIERQPRRRYANHANALASNRRQQRMLPHRPQMHHQVPPQMQPTQPQRSAPSQDRYLGARINQHPANRPRDAASNQQHHGDTDRRPSSYGSSYGEARPSRDGRHETSAGFTPYNDHSQHMHPSVNGGSRRADSRSDVEVNIPHGTLGDHQTRNALSVLYGSNWTERELQMPRVYRDSATPGGFPYSRTLDLPTGQPNPIYSYSHTSTRCPQGCPAPPGYHCNHEREQR